MADLGNLYFDILLRDMTDADIDKIKKKLAKVGVKIGVDADKATLAKNIKEALKNRTFKIDVEPNKNIKKAAIEVNKSVLTKSVSDALKGKTFSADLKLVVKKAEVQDAIRQAFSKAGMNYNTTASDVRAARVAEIQQRMAMRAAQAQRRVGDAHRYAASGAYESARASVTLGRSFHSNIRLAGELGTAMGNIASVFGIKDLLEGVVKIGGQLENQRIALGAILQDGGKATEMFAKIQSLAVKSPFGIMDLNQYTKQLSAYGIEYNELYDTMKRLADISAGVGVDMGRIILAYGQVRAAGFLKGTELRQFTEANIPLVQKLADRFSVLEKRIVSAADVYDMISKKKITFEDVKSVLWDLTDEGGMFSGMQEVLSESLASKWKNLADALDVMYGKMADGWMGGGLKIVAEILTEMTKGWKYVATAIGTATTSYLAYKASVLLGSKQMSAAGGLYNSMLASKQKEAAALRIEQTYRKLSNAEQALINTSGKLTNADINQAVALGTLNKQQALRLIALGKLDKAMLRGVQRTLGITAAEIRMAQSATWGARATAMLGNAFRSLGMAMKTLIMNPFTWVFAGLTAVMEVWSHFSQKQDEIEQRNNGIAESAKGSISTLESELKKLDSIEVGNLNEDQLRIKINEITTVIKNETSGWQYMLSEVFAKDADGNFVNSAQKQLEMLEEKMKDILEAKKFLIDNSDLTSTVIEATDGWMDESVVKNTKDYANAIAEVKKQARELAPYKTEISEAINNVSFYNPELSQKLEGKELYEQLIILREYKDEWKDFVGIINNSDLGKLKILQAASNSLVVKSEGKKKTLLDDVSTGIEKLKEAMRLDGVTDFKNIGTKWQQIVIDVAMKVVDEAGIQEPKMRQALLDMWLGAFNIKNDLGYIIPEIIVTPEKYDASKDEVAKMWKKRAEEIEKAVSLYDQWKEVEGKDKASNRVASKKELASLFNGMYGFNLNLENPEEAYRYILGKLDLNKSAQKELAIKLGVDLDEATLDDAKAQLKDFLEKSKKFIDDTTKRWDLYKELFKATGNKTVSANIAFGGSISFKDQLEQLKVEIEKELGDTGISFDKLIGMSTEELEGNGLARFKNLVEAYNKESMKMKEESVKNFIAIVNASKDFAQQISDIERKLEKDLSDLRSNAKGMSESELRRRENELIKKAEEDKNSVRFEQFKESSDWVKVFDDLDRVSNATLDNMIKNVEEFARRTNLGVKETKELVEALGKLRDEVIDRNPFKGYQNAFLRLNAIRDALKRGKQGDGLYYVKQSKGGYKPMTQSQIDEAKIAAWTDTDTALLKMNDKFQKVSQAANVLGEMFGNLGVDVSVFTDAINSIASGAATGASIGGGYGALAGGMIGVLTAALGASDANANRAIERTEQSIKVIEKYASRLDNFLSNSIGGIYTIKLDDATEKYLKDFTDPKKYASSFNVDGVRWFNKNYDSYNKVKEIADKAINEDSYYTAQLALLEMERLELERKKYIEENRKSPDNTKISDIQAEIEDVRESIRSFSQEMLNTIYSIDFKDWASQFTDSIVDAWSKGEDAAEAYKRTVSDVMRNVAASVIQQGIIGKWLEDNMKDVLDLFAESDGKITTDVYSALAELASGIGGKIGETEEFLDAWEEALNKYGHSMKDMADSSSSGSLSKGIQSVTEDTANLLGSYLNSIRQSVHVKQQLLEKLVSDDIPQMSYIAQAQLQELNQIAANTKRNADAADKIYDLVNRVVDKGSNKIKV